MLMVSTHQSKDIEWQIGLKSETIAFVEYKKHISLTQMLAYGERMEKDFLRKWTLKMIRHSYTYI
jgi:hypothetical protein